MKMKSLFALIAFIVAILIVSINSSPPKKDNHYTIISTHQVTVAIAQEPSIRIEGQVTIQNLDQKIETAKSNKATNNASIEDSYVQERSAENQRFNLLKPPAWNRQSVKVLSYNI